MPFPRIRPLPRPEEGAGSVEELRALLAALPAEFEVPEEFPSEALDEAARAIAEHASGRGAPDWDARDLPFVTVDPASSTDLDQAVCLNRSETGYRVFYAIADVPSFAELGGALDAATRERGQTVYLPDRRIGLHPDEIAEDAGSLLPEQDRWAYVFAFELDAEASVLTTGLRRAVVRSRAKLSYTGVQEDLDSDRPSEFASLLAEIGAKRIELERRRGGASLNLPEQEVSLDEDGRLRLESRAPLPVEDYNAQISLMTGMETARIFLEHNTGLLRVMPAPDEEALAEFRRAASALGTPWPEGQPYGEFLRSLDTEDPRQLAIMHAAGRLFRGAGYVALPSEGASDEDLVQAALGASYTHTTAPLRRLVDRFVLMTAELLSAGRPLPRELAEALPLLPELMKASDRKAGSLERAAVDLVEAATLQSRVGEEFRAAVTSTEHGKAQIALEDPAVVARVATQAAAGDIIRVRLTGVDLAARRLQFEDTGSSPVSGGSAVD
ncbi:RNB domain-containing ribonuclease [Arthrobacter sp. UM1]|uniref:RNB domain-containing ribonuclease n=1 Tax=Arthrobacter sp. UM1 TaxID=2766776 RepID=UPI001CF64701|nr:RNB domain-containing ribonuclease [Arthrobacter sp. UM1]MCB4207815.1 RNB domain-containing ribonuclease [Arthrobacter sp. UM1]